MVTQQELVLEGFMIRPLAANLVLHEERFSVGLYTLVPVKHCTTIFIDIYER
jgi:hypothetical protein